MHMRLLGLLAILCIMHSAGAVTYTVGDNVNFTYIVASPVGNMINGTLYYNEFVFTREPGWYEDVWTGTSTFDYSAVDATGLVGGLAGQTVSVYYMDSGANFIHLGDPITDAYGQFQMSLGGIDWTLVGADCTKLRIEYGGNDVNLPSRADSTYCEKSYYMLPLSSVSLGTCFPVFIILGLLMGAMYAAGMDPLRTFDITTPRLPGPKPKPMAGTTMYQPGWGINRRGYFTASKATEKNLKNFLRRLHDDLAGYGGGKLPSAKGPRKLISAYRRHGGLINSIMNSKLSITQKSLLLEILYLKGIRQFRTATGLRDYEVKKLRRGDAATFKRVHKHMNENSHTQKMMDLRMSLKDEVRKLQEAMRHITASEKKRMHKEMNMWTRFTMISGVGIADDEHRPKPGLRETKEYLDYMFDTSREAIGLGGRVGKFLAKTPGLRDGFATAVGTVNLIGGSYLRMTKTFAVEGVGTAIKITGKGFGGDRTKAGRWIQNLDDKYKDRFGMERHEIGRLGNGFERMSHWVKAVVAELKRRGLISADEAVSILAENDTIYKKSEKLVKRARDLERDPTKPAKKRMKPADRKREEREIARKMKRLQGEYNTLLGGLWNPLERAVEEQEQNELLIEGVETRRNKKLAEELMEIIAGGATAGDATAEANFRRARTRFMGDGSDENLLAFTETAELYGRGVAGNLGKYIAQMETIRKHMGCGAYISGAETCGSIEEIAARFPNARVEDMMITLLVNRTRRHTRAASADVDEALSKVRAKRPSKGTSLWSAQKRLEWVKGQLDEKIEKIEGNGKDMKGLKRAYDPGKAVRERDKPGNYINDIDKYGNLGELAVARILRWMEYGGLTEKLKPGDELMTKEEMKKLQKDIRDIASGGVAATMQERNYLMHKVVDRNKLEKTIAKLLREGKTEEVGKIYAALVSAEGATREEREATYNRIYQQIYASGVTIGKKDIPESSDPKAVEFGELLVDRRIDTEEKARRIANTFVESFPWYRKMRTEYLETFILNQSHRGAYSMGKTTPDGIERANYLGIDIRESARKLEMWQLANQEMLEREVLPGYMITHEDAKRKGAWLAMVEGYWIPLTSRDETRNSMMKHAIWNNIGDADKVMYGYMDHDENGMPRLRNAKDVSVRHPFEDRPILGKTPLKKLPWFGPKWFGGGVWEKALTAGLYDMGMRAEMNKAAITQSWQTLQDLNAFYHSQEFIGADGTPFTVSKLKESYMTDVLTLQKKLSEAASKEEKKRIKREIASTRRRLRALSYDRSIFDIIGGMRKKGELAAHSYDLSQRDIHDLGRMNAQIQKSTYDLAFLGIIAVRGGRATSSAFGPWGYISTYQAASTPAIMEPRRFNWVNTEWSEADVPRSAYPAGSLQQSIPILRHFTFGNYIRNLSLPAIYATQQVAAASRKMSIAAMGMPISSEPMFLKPMQGVGSSIGNFGLALTYSLPPFSLFGRAMLTMNPSKDGRVRRSRVWGRIASTGVGQRMNEKIDSMEYGIYNAYSKAGIRNYALEGTTDVDTYKVGVPTERMGLVDKTYLSTMANAYPPVYHFDPYGNQHLFPSFATQLERTAPGARSERSEKSARTEIFRRETSIYDHMEERKQQLKYEQVRSLLYSSPAFYLGSTARNYVRGKLYEHQTKKRETNECPHCHMQFSTQHYCKVRGKFIGVRGEDK